MKQKIVSDIQELFNPYKKVSTTIDELRKYPRKPLFNPYKKVSTTIPQRFLRLRKKVVQSL